MRKAHRHIVSWPKPETMLAWTGQAVSKETSQERVTAERRCQVDLCFLNSVTRKEGGGPEGLAGRDRGSGMGALHVESAGSTGKVGGAGSCQQHCGIAPGGILPGSSVLGVSINTC